MYTQMMQNQPLVQYDQYGFGRPFGSIFFPLLFLSLITRPPYYYYPYYYPYPYYSYPYY